MYAHRIKMSCVSNVRQAECNDEAGDTGKHFGDSGQWDINRFPLKLFVVGAGNGPQ